MSSRLTSSYGRGVRSALLAALLGTLALAPGCITVEDEPECEKDSDCDDDEFCNDDDECENSCRALCKGTARCSTSEVDEASCRESCATVAQGLGSSCEAAIGDVGSCFDDNSSCDDLFESCEDEITTFSAICTLDSSCPYTNDGVCDEPEFCAAGTDTVDCTTCRYTNDGFCDEPDLCPVGTDTNDCAGG